MLVAAVLVCSMVVPVSAGHLEAPTGMFKDLNDEILGDAINLNGKQLFIDDYIVEELSGVEKVLNQPVKHPRNPLLGTDQPWEQGQEITYANVMHDQEKGLFKMWYGSWLVDAKPSQMTIGYATSPDGITWTKPLINEKNRTNVVLTPDVIGFQAPGIFKDPIKTDPQRRFKMLFLAAPDGTSKTWSTNAAYSPDGIHWTADPGNPLIPFSDVQPCPFWDANRNRYVAILRWGPPNSRLITRIESEDFVHWSPKVRIFTRTKMDAPYSTVHYGMRVMPYEGVYIGVLTAYHGETIQPIPPEKEAWMNKVNAQLAFSRNGVTWSRVGGQGAIPAARLNDERDWKAAADQAVFIPYGEHKTDWDWGGFYASHPPLVVDDEIRFYYGGAARRHWSSYHGDTDERNGIGLATLRLDGFVSINAEEEGTLTTKTLVFIGDTLEVNANAKGGSIVVEVLDANGKVIEGFSKKDSIPITTDSVRHVLKWKGKRDCHLIQAMPIKLRFYLEKAKLYSFTPRIGNKHYVPSYD
jgi:hypothetical protein